MALRNDLPKIPVNDEPTIWNGEMGKWAFWGGLAATLVTGAAFLGMGGFGSVSLEAIGTMSSAQFLTAAGTTATTMYSAIATAATAAFGLIGGSRGKERMEIERREGKTVQDPTFWNKSILSNFMAIDFPLSVISTVVIGVGGAALLAGSFGSLLIAATVGATVVGISAGFEGKEKMQQELGQAIVLKEQISSKRGLLQQKSQARGHGLAQEQSAYVNSVSPQETALMEAHMRNGEQPKFAETVAKTNEIAQQVDSTR